MNLTPETFDSMLEDMEECFRKLQAAQTSVVQLSKEELNFLGLLESIRDFMNAILRIQESRAELENIFGGDCTRISRTRAVLEAAKLRDMRSGDERLSACLSACESVEKVLLEVGFGLGLRRAQQSQRLVLQQKNSMGCDLPDCEASSLPERWPQVSTSIMESCLPRPEPALHAMDSLHDPQPPPEVMQPQQLPQSLETQQPLPQQMHGSSQHHCHNHCMAIPRATATASVTATTTATTTAWPFPDALPQELETQQPLPSSPLPGGTPKQVETTDLISHCAPKVTSQQREPLSPLPTLLERARAFAAPKLVEAPMGIIPCTSMMQSSKSSSRSLVRGAVTTPLKPPGRTTRASAHCRVAQSIERVRLLQSPRC